MSTDFCHEALLIAREEWGGGKKGRVDLEGSKS